MWRYVHWTSQSCTWCKGGGLMEDWSSAVIDSCILNQIASLEEQVHLVQRLIPALLKVIASNPSTHLSVSCWMKEAQWRWSPASLTQKFKRNMAAMINFHGGNCARNQETLCVNYRRLRLLLYSMHAQARCNAYASLHWISSTTFIESPKKMGVVWDCT